MRRVALSIVLAVLLAAGRTAQSLTAQAHTAQARAPEPQVLWRDVRAEGAEAVDLVFLPDGFRSDEQADFEASVRKAVRLLESQPASFVRAERERWNVHVGFVPSSAACPPRAGAAARDTAFRTHIMAEDQGGLFESDDSGIAGAAAALAPATDVVVVVLRMEGAIPFATGDLPREGARVRLPEGFESALLHELGHSLYSLGDEYAGGRSQFPAHERSVVAFYPNITLDPGGGRFRQLGVAEPELAEGALDFRRGVQRAAGACVMRDPGADRFCPPCAAVIGAGLPVGAPEDPPRCTLESPGSTRPTWRVTLAPPTPAQRVLRRFAVLFRLEGEASGTASDEASDEDSDAALQARLVAAEARVSRKTRYMESPWLGDGSLPGETVFSLEAHVTSCELGALAPGSYAFAAAQANLRATSPAEILRFTVPAAAGK